MTVRSGRESTWFALLRTAANSQASGELTFGMERRSRRHRRLPNSALAFWGVLECTVEAEGVVGADFVEVVALDGAGVFGYRLASGDAV